MGDCTKCKPARCCSYLTVPLDTPRTEKDFDFLLWQMAHQKVSIYIEEGEWFLSVDNRCRFLGNDDRCQIYETRPQVCRDYEAVDCAYDSEYDFDMEFRTYEEFKEYVTIRLQSGGAAKVKKLQSRWKPKSWVPPKSKPIPLTRF